MKILLSKSWLRVLSGLLTNISSAALGLLVIAPAFFTPRTIEDFLLLTYDAVIGILFLGFAVRFDEAVDSYE